jgi:putative glycosyltransferase (TIGR04372 family)
MDTILFFMITEINKIKTIEIIRIYSSRIGHLCWNMNVYQNLTSQQFTIGSKIRVFILDDTISNDSILTMIRSSFPGIYIKGKFARILSQLIQVEKWKKFLVSWESIHPKQVRLANTTKWVEVPKIEINKFLVKHKLNNQESIVFHNRDEAYLAQIDGDGNQHAYRNFPFSDYAKALSTLQKLDITAIRIGKAIEDDYFADNLISLTGKNQDYWGDVTSVEISKFFVSGNSGISHLSTLLRKPHLYVNFVPFDLHHLSACAQNSIFLPKKLRNLSNGQFLSLTECIDLFRGWSIHEKDFLISRKIQIVNNSQQEINNALIEMIRRTNSNLKETLYQSEIRKKLEKLYNDSFSKYIFKDLGIRLSESFVKQNHKWLLK